MHIRLLALVFTLAASSSANAACAAMGATLTLEGALKYGVFRDGMGRPESALILNMKSPVCLNKDANDDAVAPTRKVHVFSTDENMMNRIYALRGKNVRVTGEAWGAMTVHHHAPVILQPTAIDKI